MKRTANIIAIALSMFAFSAMAADYKVGSIEISAPWARATPRGAEVGGAYMTITNKGTTTDRLVGGSSPVARRLEVHEMTMNGGVMKMRPVKSGLEIKPGATVELKPLAFHLMLIGLKEPLQKGHPIKATLQFEKAGKVDVEYQVEAMGATGASSPMDHINQMDHGAAPMGNMGH